MILYDIYFEGGERKICRNCVDKLGGGGKVREIEEGGRQHCVRYSLIIGGRRRSGGEIIGGGSDEFIIIPVVYPRGTVIVSSIGYFSSVGSSSKTSRPSLPLYIGARHIQDYFKNKRWRKKKLLIHSRIRSGKRRGEIK